MPIGYRGPPTGPRTDLSRADTGAIQHQLYVKVVTGNDPDRKSRDITLEVLSYVHSRLPKFQQMGLSIKVNRIRSQDLQNPRLVEAMRKRGITRLPALTSPNNVYIGFKEISDVYERNIKEFAAIDRREERAVDGAAPDGNDLEDFYKGEMSFERAEEDAQETGIGESDDMMDSYRHMMERREKSETGRKTPRPGGRPPSATPDGRAERRAGPPAASAAAPSRPDNVGSRRSAPIDPDDAEIQDTIDRLARDIDDNTRTMAFSSGGGDSLDDDGGSDIQDDLMERAYYANMSSTD